MAGAERRITPSPTGGGLGRGFSVRSGITQRLAPGAARHADYFLYSCKESSQRKHAPVCRPLRGYPALLVWSGGCGTRATRSNSPRRHLLTSLRYSAAHRGRKSGRCCVRKRTISVCVASVACATLAGNGYRYARPILCLLEKIRRITESPPGTLTKPSLAYPPSSRS